MITGHVRRTKPKSSHRPARRSRQAWLLSVALPALLVAPIAERLLLSGPAPGQIDILVREAGFEPVHPPSRLYGPGALYAVKGNVYWEVCGADAALLDGRTEKSPAETLFHQTHDSTALSLAGKLVDRVIAKLGVSRDIAIEYRVSDAAVTIISLANLRRVQDTLLSQQDCTKAVDEVLDDKGQVCAVAAALSATVTYREQDAATYRTVGEGVDRVGGGTTAARDEQRDGQDLFYGVRLWTRCITPSTATEPSVLAEPAKPRAAAPASSL